MKYHTESMDVIIKRTVVIKLMKYNIESMDLNHLKKSGSDIDEI